VPDDLVNQLLDFGALGIFAGFLIWQHLGMQKRLDKLVEGFQDQLKEIGEDSERRIQTMRERYDIVFTNLRVECRENEAKVVAERDALRSELAGIIREADRKIDELLIRLADR
jgi:hypothetical protein